MQRYNLQHYPLTCKKVIKGMSEGYWIFFKAIVCILEDKRMLEGAVFLSQKDQN